MTEALKPEREAEGSSPFGLREGAKLDIVGGGAWLASGGLARPNSGSRARGSRASSFMRRRK